MTKEDRNQMKIVANKLRMIADACEQERDNGKLDSSFLRVFCDKTIWGTTIGVRLTDDQIRIMGLN